MCGKFKINFINKKENIEIELIFYIKCNTDIDLTKYILGGYYINNIFTIDNYNYINNIIKYLDNNHLLSKKQINYLK